MIVELTSRFFSKVGLGMVEHEARFSGAPHDALRARGTALQLGAGVNIGLARNLSLTIFASEMRMRDEQGEYIGLSPVSLSTSILQVGLGVTWR